MQGTNDRKSSGTSDEMGGEGTTRLTSPINDSERFLADLKTFVADAESLLGQARTLSGEAAAAAREEFERRVVQAKRTYMSARTMAVDQAQGYMDRTETYVKAEPWKAVGIAALAGAVLGVLMSRR
ncbi:MAG TPA: DUF883 domain-containing protein [Casimicrobiaceae bacterium]|nr:DUF883 domain-containing protein [Casimicrobiaceae bacterium]